MQKEELKKRAKSIVQIPSHFKTVIEDILEDNPAKGEAVFLWANEVQDEEISIALDQQGHLIRLSINKKNEDLTIIPLHEEQRVQKAREFLLHHYPDALKSLTLNKIQSLPSGDIYYYKQIVMDIPLPYSGCSIEVDSKGDVIGFTYEGIKPIPEVPVNLILKEILIADLQTKLDFKLVVMQQAEGDFHLVYEPTTECMDYEAGVLAPTLTIIHDEEQPLRVVPCPMLANSLHQHPASLEDILGISGEMEVILEKDMGDERGIVWRNKNGIEKETDSTFKGVKAFIHKDTGKATCFSWFNEHKGDLRLTREESFAIATEFLHRMVPEYCPYLQLLVMDNYWIEEEDETNMLVRFMFWLHNGQGNHIQSEMVMVGVNSTTGQVERYKGPEITIDQLRQIPTEPAISKEEARERFLQHLDFKLAWHYNFENESYILAYKACDGQSSNSILCIDAMTSEVVTFEMFN